MGLRRLTSNSFIHMDLHKPNKLVSAQLEHFWYTDEPWANSNSQDSPQPKLGGSHHLPPYNILCAWARDQHPNVILSSKCHFVLGLPSESPEIPTIGILAILGAHNFACKPPIKMSFETKLQPYQELSIGMSHATCWKENRGDSRLLVVRNQIGSLGSVRVHSFTLSYTPMNMKCDSQVSFLARTLTSPCLSRKPKARVMTITSLVLISIVSLL